MTAAIYARTIIAMLFCLLAVATSASAESAWLLWIRDTDLSPGGVLCSIISFVTGFYAGVKYHREVIR